MQDFAAARIGKGWLGSYLHVNKRHTR